MKRHFACSSLLALACLSPAIHAAETDPHLSVTIAPGFDSNPRELSEVSLAKPEGGWYTELGLDTGLGIKVNPNLGFMMDLDGAVRSYESDSSGADRTWASARAGIRFTPYRNGNRGVAVSAGGVFGGRSTLPTAASFSRTKSNTRRPSSWCCISRPRKITVT